MLNRVNIVYRYHPQINHIGPTQYPGGGVCICSYIVKVRKGLQSQRGSRTNVTTQLLLTLQNKSCQESIIQ